MTLAVFTGPIQSVGDEIDIQEIIMLDIGPAGADKELKPFQVPIGQ